MRHDLCLEDLLGSLAGRLEAERPSSRSLGSLGTKQWSLDQGSRYESVEGLDWTVTQCS